MFHFVMVQVAAVWMQLLTVMSLVARSFQGNEKNPMLGLKGKAHRNGPKFIHLWWNRWCSIVAKTEPAINVAHNDDGDEKENLSSETITLPPSGKTLGSVLNRQIKVAANWRWSHKPKQEQLCGQLNEARKKALTHVASTRKRPPVFIAMSRKKRHSVNNQTEKQNTKDNVKKLQPLIKPGTEIVCTADNFKSIIVCYPIQRIFVNSWS